MDRRAVHHRLRDAGLDEERASAVTRLLWHVHETGLIDDVDLAHLSDAGFRHVEICVMRELLDAALSRRDARSAGGAAADLLEAFGRNAGG